MAIPLVSTRILLLFTPSIVSLVVATIFGEQRGKERERSKEREKTDTAAGGGEMLRGGNDSGSVLGVPAAIDRPAEGNARNRNTARNYIYGLTRLRRRGVVGRAGVGVPRATPRSLISAGSRRRRSTKFRPPPSSSSSSNIVFVPAPSFSTRRDRRRATIASLTSSDRAAGRANSVESRLYFPAASRTNFSPTDGLVVAVAVLK